MQHNYKLYCIIVKHQDINWFVYNNVIKPFIAVYNCWYIMSVSKPCYTGNLQQRTILRATTYRVFVTCCDQNWYQRVTRVNFRIIQKLATCCTQYCTKKRSRWRVRQGSILYDTACVARKIVVANWSV